MNNSDFMKIQENFLFMESINKVKQQSMEWKKIFVNHISDKGLDPEVDKNLLQFNNKKTNNPITK